MRRLFGGMVLVLCLTSPTFAQTSICDTNCTVRQGESFTVITDPIPGATTYHLLMNGTTQAVGWTIDGDGFVSFSFPSGVLVGSYSFVITATVNGSEVPTDPNTLTVVRRKVRFKFQ